MLNKDKEKKFEEKMMKNNMGKYKKLKKKKKKKNGKVDEKFEIGNYEGKVY